MAGLGAPVDRVVREAKEEVEMGRAREGILGHRALQADKANPAILARVARQGR